MDGLSSVQLAHWLMIVGAIFVVSGFLGLVFGRKKQAAKNPAPALHVPRPPDTAVARDDRTPPPPGL
jgi:LPXTG-motif cell wall-anchored protein